MVARGLSGIRESGYHCLMMKLRMQQQLRSCRPRMKWIQWQSKVSLLFHKWKKFWIIITAAGKAKLRKLSYCWQGQLLQLILHEWINSQINTPAANNAIKLMAVQMQPKLTNKQTKNQHHTFFPGERHTPLFPNPPCSLDSVNCYNITTFFHDLLLYNFTSNTNHALVLMQAILTLPCSMTVP